MRGQRPTPERGQAHTLEAFTAALLVVAGLVFAMQATAVTPLSASTSNQHIENQERAMAEDLLAASAADGTLKRAVLHWNVSDTGFVGAGDDDVFSNAGPPNVFGGRLNETFKDDGIAFNVLVRYRKPTGGYGETRLVYQGTPSDNAVVASRSVVLYDDTSLVGPDSGTNVSAAANATSGGFYASDVGDGPVFNVLEVRIVVWRM